MNGFGKFLKEHLWQIIVIAISAIVAWTLLTNDVKECRLDIVALERQAEDNRICHEEIKSKQNEIKERLVRLETKIDYIIKAE